MGRHHRPSRLSRPGRPVRRHRASALLSAAVLASVAGPGVAFAATDTTGDGSDADGGSSSTALDPAGSALGTATGTDDDAGPDPVTSTVDGAGDATDDDSDPDPAAADDDSDDTSAATTVTLAEKNDSGVSGRATITEGGAAALLQEQAHLYMGPGAKFPDMQNPPPGYLISVQIERIWDHIGSGGTWVPES